MENKNDFLNIKEEVEELGIEHILAILPILRKMPPVEAVSYTHLDVYKRQVYLFILLEPIPIIPLKPPVPNSKSA